MAREYELIQEQIEHLTTKLSHIEVKLDLVIETIGSSPPSLRDNTFLHWLRDSMTIGALASLK